MSVPILDISVIKAVIDQAAIHITTLKAMSTTDPDDLIVLLPPYIERFVQLFMVGDTGGVKQYMPGEEYKIDGVTVQYVSPTNDVYVFLRDYIYYPGELMSYRIPLY